MKEAHVSKEAKAQMRGEPSHKHENRGDGIGWRQYRYGPDQEKGEKQKKKMNSSSVSVLAKTLMAREWSKALEKKAFDPDRYALEQKAKEHKEMRDREKQRLEQQKLMLQRQKEEIQRSLKTFGKELVKAKGSITPDQDVTLLEDALHSVGEVIEIGWREGGCDVLIEPWQERRLRRESGLTLPVLYELKVGENLQVVSYGRIEDEDLRVEKQANVLMKPLWAFMRGNRTGVNVEDFEGVLSEAGRIIEFNKTEERWNVHIEPWEEMRLRNIERGGKPPLVTYFIQADDHLNIISCKRRIMETTDAECSKAP